MEAEQELSRLSQQRSTKTTGDSSDDEAAAYVYDPLVDVERAAKYQEEMKANKDLERILKDQRLM